MSCVLGREARREEGRREILYDLEGKKRRIKLDAPVVDVWMDTMSCDIGKRGRARGNEKVLLNLSEVPGQGAALRWFFVLVDIEGDGEVRRGVGFLFFSRFSWEGDLSSVPLLLSLDDT
jgi:hypothetical protein